MKEPSCHPHGAVGEQRSPPLRRRSGRAARQQSRPSPRCRPYAPGYEHGLGLNSTARRRSPYKTRGSADTTHDRGHSGRPSDSL